MTFEEYLTGKKIDPVKYQKGDPTQHQEFQKIFDKIHPESFTQQKLFLINQIRRTYKLEQVDQTKIDLERKAAPKSMRPKMKPLKPKTI